VQEPQLGALCLAGARRSEHGSEAADEGAAVHSIT
jgi:hypothetical protein